MNNEVASRAKELLGGPNSNVIFVGPRPANKRKSFSLLGATFYLMAFSVFPTIHALGGLDGVHQELMARKIKAETILATAPVDAHWIDMPTSVFIEVGRLPDGSLSREKMIKSWKSAGLNAEQMQDALLSVALISPVLMGRNDPQLEGELIGRAVMADKELQARYPEAFKKLTEMSGRGKTPNTPPFSEKDKLWLDFYTKRMDTNLTPPVSIHSEKRITQKDAKLMLQDAVFETGLKSLRVSLWDWESPERLAATAVSLKAANQDLQQATGWSGAVLGLGGRVELTIGRPNVIQGANGLQISDASGRTQVITEWPSLGHEWFHAVDAVVGRNMMSFSDGSLASESLYLIRVVKDKKAYAAWSKAESDISKVAPQWVQERKGARFNKEYWVSKSEGMAFAFGAYVNKNSMALGGFKTEEFESYRYPSPTEIEAQAPVFQKLFEDLKYLDLPANNIQNLVDANGVSKPTLSGMLFSEDVTLGRRWPTVY